MSSDRLLRNAWYVAAWADSVTTTPQRRILLDNAVVLFRTETGMVCAMADICPHRHVPLSRGTVTGSEIQCIYHGLRFGIDGRCRHNPFGPTPSGAKVRVYPTEVRHEIVWIWMGDPASADAGAIPDFSLLDDHENYVAVRGYTSIDADYELVLDNLMDLSHVEFLHPGLKTTDPEQQLHEVRQDGDTIWSMRWRKRGIPNKLMQNFWPAEPSDAHMHMRWTPPSNLFLDVGVTGIGRPTSEGIATPFAHLLTPAENGKTHYHWASIRNARRDDRDLDARIRELAERAFIGEDKPVIESQQMNKPYAASLGLKPVLLASDAAALRVQRVLDRRLAEERSPPAGISA